MIVAMMNIAPSIDLLSAIKAHCEKQGLSPSAFGIAATGDPCLIPDLEDGREPRRRTVARIMEFMLTGKTHAEVKADG